jgi:D-arabinose 1-dehydrogenase-like Zn-dependent alcohol dehydrogenase
MTTGLGEFVESEYTFPKIGTNDIEVKSIMTGICRSDIDMMQGNFGPLPLHMQGHEGLGRVTKVGTGIFDVKVGDLVATRGEPAYADVYTVRQYEYVSVPEAHPRYIIEPVACGVNIVSQALSELKWRQGAKSKLLILGSGFLAWVAYHTITKQYHLRFDIDVVGNSNQDLWGDKLQTTTDGQYDVIIDLSSKSDVFDKDLYKDCALIIMAAAKTQPVNTTFDKMLWKAVTMVFPSPRNSKFHQCMKDAVWMIENGKLDVDKFWTRSYNRNTEWQQAFKDGADRPANYSRGYIEWQ